jgi:hypothetical protein
MTKTPEELEKSASANTETFDPEKVRALFVVWDQYCSNDPDVDEFSVGQALNAVRESESKQ